MAGRIQIVAVILIGCIIYNGILYIPRKPLRIQEHLEVVHICSFEDRDDL